MLRVICVVNRVIRSAMSAGRIGHSGNRSAKLAKRSSNEVAGHYSESTDLFARRFLIEVMERSKDFVGRFFRRRLVRVAINMPKNCRNLVQGSVCFGFVYWPVRNMNLVGSILLSCV